MSMSYSKIALDKRIAQARERVAYPAAGDSQWTVELLSHLADEAELALAQLNGERSRCATTASSHGDAS